MSTIRDYIEGTVEANLKRVMAGDNALPAGVAVTIAMEAANMAAIAAAKHTIGQKRFDLACRIAGGLIAPASLLEQQGTLQVLSACKLGLSVVDQMLLTISEEEKAEADGIKVRES